MELGKKKAHSSKSNEKLGKIAFRLPVIFVTLQLPTMYSCDTEARSLLQQIRAATDENEI